MKLHNEFMGIRIDAHFTLPSLLACFYNITDFRQFNIFSLLIPNAALKLLTLYNIPVSQCLTTF